MSVVILPKHWSDLPVEDPSLLLDTGREDKDTNNTQGHEGKDDPEGSVTGVGRVEESSLGHGLSRSARISQGKEGRINIPKDHGGKESGARVHRGRGDHGGAYQFHRGDRW
jgi:hypothetical protein